MNMLPEPTLIPFASLMVRVGAPIGRGEQDHVLRRDVPILGGEVRGYQLTGIVGLPEVPAWMAQIGAGVDAQSIGDMPEPTWAQLEARYSLIGLAFERESGHASGPVHVLNRALRAASAQDTARLMRGERVDASRVYFRGAVTLSTAEPKLAWMQHRLYLCAGEREPQAVRMTWYMVL